MNYSADMCNMDTRNSTGAYVFLVDGAACTWKVRLSSTALLNSPESQYVAASEATKETLNLRTLIYHLGFGGPRPTDIHVDNKSRYHHGAPSLKQARHAARRHVCTHAPTTR